MPRLIQSYACSYCREHFPDFDACLEHEANVHFHLNITDYKLYRSLKSQAQTLGTHVYYTKNEQTEAAFDKAINKLLAFEHEHGIPKEPYMAKS